MYKTLSKTGTVIVIVIAMFSIIQVVFPVINKTIKVREGMTSGRENSLPTLTFMTGVVNEKMEPTDQTILNDMNVIEFSKKPMMWPINPTHPPTIPQNMIMQDARQKELLDAYYKNEGNGSEFTQKYPCRPTTTGEYEDCGPYGANIPCYGNGKVRDNRIILKDCCKLPAPTAATSGPAGANMSCFKVI
tara:strand:+ start:181 stop:747 length:567 start_codon:yes stop_codon:yes gene_type:complete